jgi:hypothetical protein
MVGVVGSNPIAPTKILSMKPQVTSLGLFLFLTLVFHFYNGPNTESCMRSPG